MTWPVCPHLEAQQWRSGATGDKLQQLALFLLCEAFDHLPEGLDDRMSRRVPTWRPPHGEIEDTFTTLWRCKYTWGVISSYPSSLWTFWGHPGKLAHGLLISAPVKGREVCLRVCVWYRCGSLVWRVLCSVPAAPAGQTCAATPGWPRWPAPAWRPGSEAWSVCSACSRPPNGCKRCGLLSSQECLCLQVSVPPPGSTEQQTFVSPQ